MVAVVPDQDRCCGPVSDRIEEALRAWAPLLPEHARAIDIGAGPHPPYRGCLPAGWSYLDVDLDAGDVHADALLLPFRSGSLDAALSNAVLEHLPDPAAALEETARILRPGGVLILATHGIYPYHPCPDDYTRWTRSGLDTLVGRWFDVESVHPLGGIILTLAVLVGFYLELLATRSFLFRPARLLVSVVVRLGSWLDRLVPTVKDGRERYGAMSSGYLVLARARR